MANTDTAGDTDHQPYYLVKSLLKIKAEFLIWESFSYYNIMLDNSLNFVGGVKLKRTSGEKDSQRK